MPSIHNDEEERTMNFNLDQAQELLNKGISEAEGKGQVIQIRL